MVSLPTKICTVCKENKPLFEYGRTRATSDGLNYSCKICVKNAKSETLNETLSKNNPYVKEKDWWKR